MKPNTALGFILAGVALHVLAPSDATVAKRRIGQLLAVLVMVLGAEALAQYALGTDWGLDGWWFDALSGSATPYAARMSHMSAVCFLLSGAALVGSDAASRGRRWPSALSAVIVSAMGLLAFVGHIYGAAALYAVGVLSTMAVHTGAGFFLLGIGVLCMRAGQSPWQLLTGEGLGSTLARVALPLAVVFPVLVGWLRLQGERMGFYEFEFGLTLFAMANVLIFAGVLWGAGVMLNRIDLRRRISDDAMRESERRAREIVESLPLLVWTFRPDGECDYLSTQWLRYTGVPESEQLGSGWLDRLHPDDRGPMNARWRATAARGRSFEAEFRIRRHDGVYRWFKTRAEVMRDVAGATVKWFGSCTDIDDTKRAEETRARLAAIVESSDDAIVGKTLDGFVTSWNRGAEKLFGYSEAEMLGRPIQKIVPTDRQSEEDLILGRITIGESILHFRTVRLRKNGSEVPLSVTVSPVRDASGRIIGASKVARDITEQIRAEEELRRAQAELEQRVEVRTRELAESNESLRRSTTLLAEAQAIARLGSWTLDTATGEVQWSEQLFHIVGLNPASIPPNYQEQEKLFSPDSWLRLGRAIDNSVRTGEGYELELETLRPDGALRWAVARAVAQRDATGRISRLTGTFQDVTEIKRTRDELDTAALRMRLATNAAALGVWDWAVGENKLNWDETMRQFYGWAGEVTYAVWRSAVHPDDLAEAEAAVGRALRGEKEFDHVFRIRTPGEHTRWIHGVAVVYRDATGDPVRMVGVNRDVTSEHEAGLKLRASEGLLREFVRHAPAAIAMFDRELRYLQVSERWLIDYKLSESAIIGRGHYEIFPDIPEEWKAVHRRVLAGAVERCDEAAFPRPDGSVEWLQWEVRPWRDALGQIGGLIMFTLVITERKRMEIDLRCQKQELQRSNQELEQFAYVASHDLQEPLRAVTGCVQLLQKRYGPALDAKAGELIQHSVEGANRMQTLILDLLTYSRVGSGALRRVQMDLAEPLADAMANLRLVIQESGAEVTTDEPLPILWADRGRLAQLLQNLLGNALKYRAPDRAPRIHVGVVREGDGWEISVADNGIGIEPRYFERIFVIFQRLHTRSEYSGTGIGLAICKKIVERHGGRIAVKSVPGAGSTFFFSIKDNIKSS